LCNAVNDSNIDTKLLEPEKLDFRNKPFNYDIYFKDKKFHLPLCKRERPFKESKILDKRHTDIKGKSWGIERYDYKECFKCGHPLIAMDPLRGERVCECGLTNKRAIMIVDMDLKKQRTNEPLRTKEDSLTFEEKKFIKRYRANNRKKGIKTFTTHEKVQNVKVQVDTSMQSWRKKQYVLILGTISSQLLMSKPQKDKVKDIIDEHSLKMFHNRVDQHTIIAGICRYILMKDRNGGELRFNRSVFQFVGLNEANYGIIKVNMERLGL
jgi:hypothetical protein